MLAASPAPAAAQGVIRDAEIEDTLARLRNAAWPPPGCSPEDVSIYIIDRSSS